MRRHIIFQFLVLTFFLGTQALFAAEPRKDQKADTEAIVINDIRITDDTGSEEEIPSKIRKIMETLRVLDFETARQIALLNNPSLAAAQERVRQARERVMQARSAYFPRLDASASASRIWRSDTALEVLGDPDDPENRFTSGLKATWTLFDGFARKFRNLSARYGEKESREGNADARRMILAAVASGFYNAQLARENIAIAKADEEFNGRQAEEARLRREVGTGSLSDVLNFEVQVNSARTRLLLSRQEYEVAMYGLAALLGLPESRFRAGMGLADLGTETPEEMLLPEPEPLISYAHQHRPDLLQRRYAVKVAESGIGETKAGFYPTVNLGGAVDGERTENTGFEREDFGSSLTLTFNFNLFEGGNTLARVREARARKAEVENILKDTRIAVTSEVLQALETLKLAQDQLVLQRSNAKLVQRNRDLVEKEYQAGQASLVRLNEAQRDLTQAQSRLALALVSLRRAWQNLKVSTGEILESFGETTLPGSS